MTLRCPLSASFGILAAAVLASSAGAVPLNYSVVIAESDITSTMSVGATVDVNPDFLNQFPQFGTLSGTSTSQPTSASHAVADVGLPGGFANGANGITFSELTFTTLPAPGTLSGFGAISVPFDLLGSNIQLIAYTVKVASLTLTLDAPLSSPLIPTGNPNEWAWAGVGSVTLSGVIRPTVDIPSDAVPAIELDPVPYSQSISMPLAGLFSGDSTSTRVTLGIPLDTLQDQALAIPPVAIPLDLGGLGLVTGVFGLNGLVLADLSTAIVYQNATPITEPSTAALVAIGLIGIALRHRRS
jgi:hypothetical protein